MAGSLTGYTGVTNSTINLGRYLFCALSYVGDTQGASSQLLVYPTDAPDALGKRNWALSATGGSGANSANATCF